MTGIDWTDERWRQSERRKHRRAGEKTEAFTFRNSLVFKHLYSKDKAGGQCNQLNWNILLSLFYTFLFYVIIIILSIVSFSPPCSQPQYTVYDKFKFHFSVDEQTGGHSRKCPGDGKENHKLYFLRGLGSCSATVGKNGA